MSAYEGWAIVELMGHRRLAGQVSEVEQYGSKLLRLDIPIAAADGQPETSATQFYGGSAIYCVTPATEEVARALAERLGDPRPVMPVSYRLPPPPPAQDDDDDVEFALDDDAEVELPL